MRAALSPQPEPHLLIQRKQELVEQYGPWTAANIHLGGGVYTIDPARPCSRRLARIIQLISDATRRPFHELRVLDLACLEGEHAIELACRGAEVVGIEGRAGNLAKARFARDALGLDNLKLVQDDVRYLSREEYGTFNVVLCTGILYHLDTPEVAGLLHRIFDVCREWVILDTHVSTSAKECFVYEGRRYWGRRFVEHHRKSTLEERQRSPWASLDNPSSFWLTRPSLYNALTDVGFTSVTECHTPHLSLPPDRLTVVAAKNAPVMPVSAGACPVPLRWPEEERGRFGYFARRHAREIAMRLPSALTRVLRRAAGDQGAR